MTLRYISLHLDFDSGYKDSLKDSFNLSSRFISNYLSVQIRKLKYATDGTFNMIGVTPSLNIKHICRIVGDNALQVRIPFDDEDYIRLGEIDKYETFLKLLEDGYHIANSFKEIPLNDLLKLHDLFRANGYKNEWLHKRKKFKDFGIEVQLNCFFTTSDFQLVIQIENIENIEKLISGTIIRSLPNEVHFQKDFKDILVDNGYLIVTDFLDRPRIRLLLLDIQNKLFKFEILGEGIKYITYNPAN